MIWSTLKDFSSYMYRLMKNEGPLFEEEKELVYEEMC